ncbi:MAG: hypothetical protein BWY82_01666 [Verrucomicrobia bacterium ADurb.Bin474]|nr:MAG: hypothetical protein BWY82_01666 [Verrucomicrobia bacterium ADurb.Bin474]
MNPTTGTHSDALMDNHMRLEYAPVPNYGPGSDNAERSDLNIVPKFNPWIHDCSRMNCHKHTI